MKYSARFPNQSIQKKFEKALLEIPQKNIQDSIMEMIEGLEENPRPFGQKIFKTLKPSIRLWQWSAQYRLRAGDDRILYDVDDERKIVWILALRKRNEQIYKS